MVMSNLILFIKKDLKKIKKISNLFYIMNSSTKNILIVVDFQNCFISGGSLGLGSDELESSKDQAKEILFLIAENDIIYLTRDYHPIDHLSLRNTEQGRYVNLGSVFPNHCRNPNSICKNRPIFSKDSDLDNLDNLETNLFKDVISKDLNKSVLWNDKEITKENRKQFNFNKEFYPVVGTDLSYLYFDESISNLEITNYYKPIIFDLIKDGKKDIKINTIGLKYYNFNANEPNIDYINWNVNGIVSQNNKVFVQLTKGEFCDYESYSAFNYHQKFKQNEQKEIISEPIGTFIKKYSTGLWENILKKQLLTYDKNKKITLNITVCGLVGNICVMNTVHHGLATWNNKYQKEYPNVTVNYIYSFPGTRFLPGSSPFKLEKSNYQTTEEIQKARIMTYIKTDFNSIVKLLPENSSVVYKTKNGVLDENEVLGENKQNGGTHPKNCACYQCNSIYKNKYLKYKQKYLELRNKLN